MEIEMDMRWDGDNSLTHSQETVIKFLFVLNIIKQSNYNYINNLILK